MGGSFCPRTQGLVTHGSPGAGSSRTLHPARSLACGRDPLEFTISPHADAQMPENWKVTGPCLFLFYFFNFEDHWGKVHLQGFIQSRELLLLTFIHFLSAAFLSGFIKGIILHSESFSSLKIALLPLLKFSAFRETRSNLLQWRK